MRHIWNRTTGILITAVALTFFLAATPAFSGTITVTSSADSGPGSLRDAISQANANPGPDTIKFGKKVKTIDVGPNELPALTNAGTTIKGHKKVVLDGTNVVAPGDDGLTIRASNAKVTGLTIQNFPRHGIIIVPMGTGTIPGNISNIEIRKNTLRYNNRDGLYVTPGRQSNKTLTDIRILHNKVLDNADDGIVVDGISSKLEASDDPFLGNNSIEVLIDKNTISGSRGEGSISGNTGAGIRILAGKGDHTFGNHISAVISRNKVSDSANSANSAIVAVGNVARFGQVSSAVNTIDVVITGNKAFNSGLNGNKNAISITGGGRSGGPGGTNNVVNFVISRNRVDGATNHGINVGGGGGNQPDNGGSHQVSGVISRNKVTNVDNRGININGGRGDFNIVNVDIERNSVKDTGERGIGVFGGSSGGGNGGANTVHVGTLYRNKVKNAGLEGIMIARGNASTNNLVSVSEVRRNHVRNSAATGIRLTGSLENTGTVPVSKNHSDKNGGDGISLGRYDGYVLTKNHANNNAGGGIVAYNNTDGGKNKAKGNAFCNTPGCY